VVSVVIGTDLGDEKLSRDNLGRISNAIDLYMNVVPRDVSLIIIGVRLAS
jgi:hypothetical protein